MCTCVFQHNFMDTWTCRPSSKSYEHVLAHANTHACMHTCSFIGPLKHESICFSLSLPS